MGVKDKCGNFHGGSGAGREITWEGATGATPWTFNSGATVSSVNALGRLVGWSRELWGAYVLICALVACTVDALLTFQVITTSITQLTIAYNPFKSILMTFP